MTCITCINWFTGNLKMTHLLTTWNQVMLAHLKKRGLDLWNELLACNKRQTNDQYIRFFFLLGSRRICNRKEIVLRYFPKKTCHLLLHIVPKGNTLGFNNILFDQILISFCSIFRWAKRCIPLQCILLHLHHFKTPPTQPPQVWGQNK